MDLKDINILSEAIEYGAEVVKLLIASEIALNDGDTESSLKNNKNAQQLFNTMKKDVILEVKEVINIDN